MTPITGEDWTGHLKQYDTVRDWLDDARVVRFEAQPDGTVEVEERCDDYFSCHLTREQLLMLSDELRAMALPPAAPINDVLSQRLDAGAIVRYPDSLDDCVSYAALKAEARLKENP